MISAKAKQRNERRLSHFVQQQTSIFFFRPPHHDVPTVASVDIYFSLFVNQRLVLSGRPWLQLSTVAETIARGPASVGQARLAGLDRATIGNRGDRIRR